MGLMNLSGKCMCEWASERAFAWIFWIPLIWIIYGWTSTEIKENSEYRWG